MHKPVLIEEFLDKAQDMKEEPKFFLDGTFGRGGHTKVLLEAFPEIKGIAIDQDPEALKFGEIYFKDYIKEKRLSLFQKNFSEMDELTDNFDLILMDLGVSSPQLDQAIRGFSFYKDGPLDMRMNPALKITAQDIVNTWREEDLIHLFKEYGEIRSPYKVVRAIVHDRKKKKFEKTQELSKLIERLQGWKKKGHHPATSFFMALRLQVNQELENLSLALPKAVKKLKDSGRLFVISFHSLEDRLVKRAFKSFLDQGFLVNKKVIQATWDEKKSNPRSRSAKMRVFQKGVKL